MQGSGKPLVGILQCGEAPEGLESLGDYDTLFHDLLGHEAFSFKTWRALDSVLPETVNEADAWLVTGSRFGAYEDHDWIAPLEAFVREVQAAAVPMLGICFGHQVIAQALGGRVEKFSGGWSVGRSSYRWQGDPAVALQPDAELPLMAWHQDQVIEPPETARTVAASDFCQHAALVYGESTFTVQPHPEFGPDFVDGLIRVRGKNVPQTLIQAATDSLDAPLKRDAMAEAMRQFLLDGVARKQHAADS